MTTSGSQADELLSILELEPLGMNTYQGDPGSRAPGTRLYGGQVLTQALVAAAQTSEPDLHIHSLHAYFLRPGFSGAPLVYSVDPIRDGRSFATRNVVAEQNGKRIFSMSVSFHREEDGLTHQVEMPVVPGPEGVEEDYLVHTRIGEETGIVNQRSLEGPFDMRSTMPVDRFMPGETTNPQWIRFKKNINDDQRLHTFLLAYISDMDFLRTAIRPHRDPPGMADAQLASLDHTIWFLRPFRIDEWLLYDVDSIDQRNTLTSCT